jgi:hypothetical protein
MRPVLLPAVGHDLDELIHWRPVTRSGGASLSTLARA